MSPRSSSIFSRLLEPLTVSRLLAHVAQRQTLHVARARAGAFDRWVPPARVDELLTPGGDGLPYILTREGVFVDDQRSRVSPAGWARALEAVHAGKASVVVLGLQQKVPELVPLQAELFDRFRWRTNFDLVVSPPSMVGVAPHMDRVDTLVLQLRGTKTWTIYPPVACPLEPRPDDGRRDRIDHDATARDDYGEPERITQLEPGDLLFFPADRPHTACAGPSSPTMHLTIAFWPLRWRDLVDCWLDAVTEAVSALDHPIAPPDGWCGTAPDVASSLRSLVHDCLAQATEDPVFLADRELMARSSEARASWGAEAAASLGPSSRVAVWTGTRLLVRAQDDERIRIGSTSEPGAWLEGSARLAPIAAHLAHAEGPVCIADLPEVPSRNARLALVRRLLAKGWLRIVADP